MDTSNNRYYGCYWACYLGQYVLAVLDVGINTPSSSMY